MAPEAVQPLRINKGNSPFKMASPSVARPLAEIGPMERRRNSPSFNQTTRKLALPAESSPFESSPRSNVSRAYQTSPTRFDSENSPFRDSSSSPTRRTSLEKLQQASRVKNSSMFAREQHQKYDPSRIPTVERPLATRGSFGAQFHDNAHGSAGLDSPRSSPTKGHRRTESTTNIAPYTSSNEDINPRKSISPSREQPSPTKSSISSNMRYAPATFDAEGGVWSDDDEYIDSQSRAPTPRAILRSVKSVTFDNAPPQVNEYEMITPDPSSVASGSREGSFDSEAYEFDDSFDRASDIERDDSFDESLEDTHKTPVVLPEDWRFMSPEAARTGLANTFEDPFDKREISPSPSAEPRVEAGKALDEARSGSLDSNGNPRPLPPLPSTPRERSDSNGHSMSTDMYSKSQRSLPSPPRPACVSKADILKMRESPLPLDERLRLLSVQEQSQALKRAQEQNGSGDLQHMCPNLGESPFDESDHNVHGVVENSKAPPRISRESILRTVNGKGLQNFFGPDDELMCTDPVPDQNEIDYANLDPDIPIPSRETSSAYDHDVINVKQEDDEHRSILESSPSSNIEYNRESSVIRHAVGEVEEADGDDESSILQAYVDESAQNHEDGSIETEDFATPKPEPVKKEPSSDGFSLEHSRMSLPEFTFLDDDFGLHLRLYTSPSPPPVTEINAKELTEEPKPAQPDTTRASTPVGSQQTELSQTEEEQPGTPDSVIHRGATGMSPEPESPEREAPIVPEPVATIKAPGSKLKTRASATPADLQAMAATRRQVSGEQAISGAYDNADDNTEEEDTVDAMIERNRSLRMQLEAPVGETDTGFGLALDTEFDRLLEAKKKGYLMRQNTKVIVASNRQVSDDNQLQEKSSVPSQATNPAETRGPTTTSNTSRKPSAQTWTTEPWNGKMRRQSVRQPNINSERRVGVAPPLPGSASNVSATEAEPELTSSFDDENAERGRLFVKVVGVKELDLPLPTSERSWFQLTLDNGLHCVTTTWLELGKSAPIGQEFELVVFEDLEFQLTLQTKIERPKSQASSVGSITKASRSPQKAPAFSRLFTSPKKRREQEKKYQEEEKIAAQLRQQELEAKRMSVQPTAWDLLHNLIAPDGSFARAYVSLKNHEREAFGRPYTVDIPCWNEWATEESIGASSTRSKLGGIQRMPPYKIGKIELQLLYIPKPKGVKDEDMPKSMSACVRELQEAEKAVNRQFEGHLSQQGGDCPYWRRRFFRLDGSKLTAYHESTRQPRATINLMKATKLIDDKTSLTQSAGISKTTTRGGRSRRKSAFAEDEEGYMFVEEGFRIRFANGEVIDFYAENAAQKDEWMKVLSDVVGKDVSAEKVSWTSAILAKERVDRTRKASVKEMKPPAIGTRAGSKSVPSSPAKKNSQLSHNNSSASRTTASSNAHAVAKQPPPIEKSPRHSAVAPSPRQSTASTVGSAGSPTKSSLSPAKVQSPLKTKSPVKKDLPAPTPRDKKAGSAKRGLVRSMIF